jgi:two-component system, LytTR family, sensor kinase
MAAVMNKKALYWICQLGGWSFFFLIQSFTSIISGEFNTSLAITLSFYSFFGLTLSHTFRLLIIKADWLRLNVLRLIPRVLIGCVVFSTTLYYLHEGFQYVLTDGKQKVFELDVTDLTNIFALTIWFFPWPLIYFLFHYVENYKKAEIENLKWQASINEIELNKLKSQLNPHFMFNAMNSIRALVDENPARAKDSITQLSNILRNTLQMGKNRVISFGQEFTIVKDYLDLETTRFEERLKVKFEVDPGSERFEVPPLMMQTLVENGIKHGISRLPEGGEISITTKTDSDKLHIYIRNSGQLNGSHDNDSGFGIKNTRQRLQLLYGGKALLNMSNENNGTVLTELIIPKLNGYESDHH